jgi:hypothetical protein
VQHALVSEGLGERLDLLDQRAADEMPVVA